MDTELRLVLLTTRYNVGSLICANYLLRNGIKIQAIVESTNLYYAGDSIRSVKKYISIMGISQFIKWLLLVAYTEAGIALAPLLSIFGRSQKLQTFGQIRKNYGIPIIKTTNINSPEMVAKLKSLKPDIILSTSFNQILKKSVIDIPKYRCVNIHTALVQDYRGMNSYFWLLANNETISGVTVHEIDEGIDTGDIIAQRSLNVENSDTGFGYTIKLFEECPRLFIDSLEKILSGYSVPNDTSRSRYYSIPTKEAYREFVNTGRKFAAVRDFERLF